MNNTLFNQNGRVSALVIAVIFIAGTMAIGCKEERPTLSVGDIAPEFEAKWLFSEKVYRIDIGRVS